MVCYKVWQSAICTIYKYHIYFIDPFLWFQRMSLPQTTALRASWITVKAEIPTARSRKPVTKLAHREHQCLWWTTCMRAIGRMNQQEGRAESYLPYKIHHRYRCSKDLLFVLLCHAAGAKFLWILCRNLLNSRIGKRRQRRICQTMMTLRL